MFPTTWVAIWELRKNLSTWVVYRFNWTEWIIDWSGTPSSALFPTIWNKEWDIRVDILTGRKYLWDWSAWILQANSADADQDWIPDISETVSDLGITTGKLADNAVTKAKLGYVSHDVTVLTWETVGTATVATWSIILGVYSKTNQDQFIDSVSITTTTLTLTLAAAATADNVFTVITIA